MATRRKGTPEAAPEAIAPEVASVLADEADAEKVRVRDEAETDERETDVDREAAKAQAELAAKDPVDEAKNAESAPRRRPRWMVPTEDGLVPESVVQAREREQAAEERASRKKQRDEREADYARRLAESRGESEE